LTLSKGVGQRLDVQATLKSIGPLVAVEAQSRSAAVQAWNADGVCTFAAPPVHGVRAAARLAPLLVDAWDSLSTTETDALAARPKPRIACLRGPGAFTGLRLCAFCVRALAWDAQCAIVPVDHLAAVAAPALLAGQRVFVAVSLKKDTTFIAVYDGVAGSAPRPVLAPIAVSDSLGPTEEQRAVLATTDVALGSAWQEKSALLRTWMPAHCQGCLGSTAPVRPLGVALAALGQASVTWSELLPSYGQASAAELQLLARKARA
jgi:tRNA A37 threonylcarbamoyladenosine modification protein TsaB